MCPRGYSSCHLFIVHSSSVEGDYTSMQLLHCNLFIIHSSSLEGGYASTQLLHLFMIQQSYLSCNIC